MAGNSEINQLERIIEVCGTPEDDPWFREIKVLRSYHEMLAHLCKEKKPSTHRKAIYSHRHHAQEEGLDLLTRLLTINPNNRISADEALDHDYFWKSKPVDPKAVSIFLKPYITDIKYSIIYPFPNFEALHSLKQITTALSAIYFDLFPSFLRYLS